MRNFLLWRLHLGAYGFLERPELVFRQNDQKGLQQYDAFSQASIQVVVYRIHGLPIGGRLSGDTAAKIIRRLTKVVAQVSNHFLQGANLVEELRALGEEYPTQQVTHSGSALFLGAFEIRRIERRSVRNGAVVFCVFREGPEKRAQAGCQPRTKIRSYTNCLVRFRHASGTTQLDSFVQRNAEHGVDRFELFRVSAENLSFLLRQPSAPVILNRGKGIYDPHERTPEFGSITKSTGCGVIFFPKLTLYDGLGRYLVNTENTNTFIGWK
jgi:hypothetical protein